MDEEGDLCTLVDATFSDFVQTALEASCGRQILKLQVAHVPLILSPEDLELIAEYVDVETERAAAETAEYVDIEFPQDNSMEDSDSFLGEDWEFVDCALDFSSNGATSMESQPEEAEDE